MLRIIFEKKTFFFNNEFWDTCKKCRLSGLREPIDMFFFKCTFLFFSFFAEASITPGILVASLLLFSGRPYDAQTSQAVYQSQRDVITSLLALKQEDLHLSPEMQKWKPSLVEEDCWSMKRTWLDTSLGGRSSQKQIQLRKQRFF